MIDRTTASALAATFDTPLYVYDLDQVEARCRELFALLPRGSRLFYSLKANPLPAVAAAAREAGCRAEISSEGELAAALEAGFSPDAMLYTGPAKCSAELDAALAHGVRAFSAESLRDLERIGAAARRAGTVARVLLRVNPLLPPRAGLAMTGVGSQFGFDEEELEASLPGIRAIAGVEIDGTHTYFGTQIVDARALEETFAAGLRTAARAAALFPLRVADLGGGFPWPFATSGSGIDLAPLRPALERAAGGESAELWFESGRYIAASCGTLVARVAEVKRSRGTTFVILDAGVSHLGGMAGLGRLLRPSVSLIPLQRDPGDARQIADVVGPLCTPLDCIARGIEVPYVEPGDLVAVPNCGAYGATASLTHFLSRRPAIEISLRGDDIADISRLRTSHERERIPNGAAHGLFRDPRAVAVRAS